MIVTLVGVLAAIVLTFVGAFRGGATDGLFRLGIFGFVGVSIVGWVMLMIYNRTHGLGPDGRELPKTPEPDGTADAGKADGAADDAEPEGTADDGAADAGEADGAADAEESNGTADAGESGEKKEKQG